MLCRGGEGGGGGKGGGNVPVYVGKDLGSILASAAFTRCVIL